MQVGTETVYIVVENIPNPSDEDDIYECVCPALGYYTSYSGADKKAIELSTQAGEDDKFGVIPLEHTTKVIIRKRR